MEGHFKSPLVFVYSLSMFGKSLEKCLHYVFYSYSLHSTYCIALPTAGNWFITLLYSPSSFMGPLNNSKALAHTRHIFCI